MFLCHAVINKYMWWTGELCRAWQQGWTPSFQQENGSKDKEQVNKGKQVHKLKLKWTEYKTKFIIRAETPSDSNIIKTWERIIAALHQWDNHRTRFRWVCLLPPCLRFIFWRKFSHFSFHFWFYVILLYTHLHLQTYLHINIIHFMKDVCRFVVIAAVRSQMDVFVVHEDASAL